MKRLMVLIALVAVGVMLATSADARPRYRGWNSWQPYYGSYVYKKKFKRKKRFKRAKHRRARTVVIHRDPDNPNIVVHGADPLISVAKKYVGRSGPSLGLPSRLWCGDFMCKVLREAGRPCPSNRRWARAYAYIGRPSNGKVGDIAVLSRGQRAGHVAIKVGSCHGGVLLLGGNQGRRVTTGCYSSRRVLAYRSV